MHKLLLAASLCFITMNISAQQVLSDSSYYFEQPKEWTHERFAIPMAFAPSIPLKGLEDIRFTPGWSKTESSEYWSYAFVWFVDPVQSIDAATLQQYLSAYYSGIAAANADTTRAKALLPAIATISKVKTIEGDMLTCTGTVAFTNFLTWQPLLLNLKVRVKQCVEVGKTVFIVEASPQPTAHTVWTSLDRLAATFRCRR